MQRYRALGFVGSDTLTLRVIPRVGWLIEGEIACKGRIVVSVHKLLDFVPRGDEFDVQTRLYAYNVRVLGQGNVFRYDNQHTHEKHPDPHHKDIFRFPSGEKLAAEWIGADRWPTLGEVIAEALEWHADNYGSLVAPESFVPADQLAGTLRL